MTAITSALTSRAAAASVRRILLSSSPNRPTSQPLRSFSTAPHVTIDRFTSTTNNNDSNSTSHHQHVDDDHRPVLRHPNDVHERNAPYASETSRTVGSVTSTVRNDWSKSEIAAVYRLPFHELMHRASTVHRMYWDPAEVQQCTLLSIKTGGCTEDCSYCSQSTRHRTFVKPTPTMKVREVLEAAKRAKDAGSSEFDVVVDGSLVSAV